MQAHVWACVQLLKYCGEGEVIWFIEKWYKCINGKPGFNSESIKALKLIADKSKSPLYCFLIIDEMTVRKKNWDKKLP